MFPGAVGTLTMVCACGCQYLIMLTSRKVKEKTEHLHGLPKLLVTSLVVFIGVPSFGRVLAHLVDPTFSSFVGNPADRDICTLIALMVVFISIGIIVAYNEDIHKYFGGRVRTKMALCVYISHNILLSICVAITFFAEVNSTNIVCCICYLFAATMFLYMLWLSMLTALVISNKYEAENLRHLIEETFYTSSDESSDDGSDDSSNSPATAGAIRICIQSSKLLYTNIKHFLANSAIWKEWKHPSLVYVLFFSPSFVLIASIASRPRLQAAFGIDDVSRITFNIFSLLLIICGISFWYLYI